jgi:hypothetical protein
MKNLSQICWAIEWCTSCNTLNMFMNPCHDTDTNSLVSVPDHIPDEQILIYLESTGQEKRNV